MNEQKTDTESLQGLRHLLAPHVAANAAFDGWNGEAVRMAAEAKSIDPDVAALALGDSAMDLIDAWIAWTDAEMQRRLPPEKLEAMGMTARIRALLVSRFDIAAPHREAVRRAMAIMAMPQNALRTAKISWRSSDLMWRLAGDSSTDYNHYSKRAILSAVYSSTLLVFIDDDSEGHAETLAFLDRRLENVKQFEKAKAKWTGRESNGFSVSQFIGRLRYPA